MGRRLRCTVLAAALAAASAPGRPRAEEGGRPAGGDFDGVNPGIGFGWLGVSDVPVGDAGGLGDALEAPVVGVRWWMGSRLGRIRGWGLDLGFGVARSSVDVNGTDARRTGLLLHLGVPLALAANRHMALELVPEVNMGFGSGSVEIAGGNADVSGNGVAVGVRAGAEIFFGFVGLPRLALEAGVGLALAREVREVELPGGGRDRRRETRFGTSRLNDPWDLFRSTVAARYYF